MPEPGERDRNTEVVSDKTPRILESVGPNGRIELRRRNDGDFLVTKIGVGGGRISETAFSDFTSAQEMLPIFRAALPPINELYPEPPESSEDTEQHIILPGEKRTDDFRKKWLHPLGANTAPVTYIKGDELKKELITEQTAKGNLVIAQGDTSAEFPMHDRLFHLFGLLATPEDSFRILQYLAKQVPDLAKMHPQAASTVRKALAKSLDAASNAVIIPGASLYLPSLDVLNSLVINTKTYSGSNQDSTGRMPNDFVHSVLNERGFRVVQSEVELGETRQPLSSGGGLSFVNHIKRNPLGDFVVPREHAFLVDYVPKLVDHLKTAPVPDPERKAA